jgi:protein SCO1
MGRKHRNQLGALMVLLALLIVSCQATAANYEYKGSLVDPPVALPDFALKTVDGSLFHLSDLEGKIALVFFGYTNCPDICPLTVAEVRQALNSLEEAEREKVQFVFVSVDPERDTPEVLERYLSNFDANFIGLTDDLEKTQEVMKAYWAYTEKEAVPLSLPDQPHTAHGQDQPSADYLVSHNGRVYLVTPERKLLLMYPFEFKAEDLRSDLSYLLKQRSN